MPTEHLLYVRPEARETTVNKKDVVSLSSWASESVREVDIGQGSIELNCEMCSKEVQNARTMEAQAQFGR